MKEMPCHQFLYDSNTSDFTCDFWILNFQFEIFYDLGKHYDTSANKIDPVQFSLDTAENDGARGSRLALNDLPTEMLSRIFSLCTAVELLAVRSVCVRWQQLIEQDKALWSHVALSAVDFDVKTTVSLLKEMPLLRTVHLCDVYSPEDMRLLILALCHDCWELRHVYFPEHCQVHPSSQDLHDLSFYHPRIESLQLCTIQKLTAVETANIGQVLAEFSYLKRLSLEGFYWYQPQLMTDLFADLPHLTALRLTSLPGVNSQQLRELATFQPNLQVASINTSSLPSKQLDFSQFKHLNKIEIIDSSPITNSKLTQLSKIHNLTSLNLNLSSSIKENVINYFQTLRPHLQNLTISNCEFSNDLLAFISQSCPGLVSLIWLNPKDVQGEVSDSGISAITKLGNLRSLEIKSRSVSKAHYADLARMKCLKYVRINGMRIPGCS